MSFSHSFHVILLGRYVTRWVRYYFGGYVDWRRTRGSKMSVKPTLRNLLGELAVLSSVKRSIDIVVAS
jgi:hypothetical protein